MQKSHCLFAWYIYIMVVRVCIWTCKVEENIESVELALMLVIFNWKDVVRENGPCNAQEGGHTTQILLPLHSTLA